MKRAVINLRVSDPKQIAGTSLETQELECRRFCEQQGYKVVDLLRFEGISAEKSNTERIKELFEYCKGNKGNFDVMVVYKVSRFARSKEHHFWLKSQFRRFGLMLRSATEQIDETPMGALMEGVLASFSEFDNEVRREGSKKGLWRRVDEGLYPWGISWGYCRPKVDGVRLMPDELDESCWRDIRKLFELYSSGNYTQVLLAQEMNKVPVYSKSGKKFNFTTQRIDHILNNIHYTGFNRNLEGKLVKGLHPAIVDTALFERCQEVLSGKSNQTKSLIKMHVNPDFPLRKFVSCGKCDKPLTGCWSGRKGMKKAYYFCYNKDCEMYSQGIKKVVLEEEFANYLKQVKPKDSLVELFNKTVLKRFELDVQNNKAGVSRKEKNVAEIELEISYYIAKNRSGVISDAIVGPKLIELEDKLLFARKLLIDKYDEDIELRGLLEFARQFIRTIDLAWCDGPIEDKIKIQRMIFPIGVKWNFSGYSNTRLAYSYMAIQDFSSQASPLGDPSRWQLERFNPNIEAIFQELRGWQSSYKPLFVQA